MAWLRKVPKNISIVDNLFFQKKKAGIVGALALALMIEVSGGVSGRYFNPAVSIAAFVSGQLEAGKYFLL